MSTYYFISQNINTPNVAAIDLLYGDTVTIAPGVIGVCGGQTIGRINNPSFTVTNYGSIFSNGYGGTGDAGVVFNGPGAIIPGNLVGIVLDDGNSPVPNFGTIQGSSAA